MSIRRRLMMQGKIAYTYEDAAYICNENGGFIDTGFMPNQNTRVVIDWMPVRNAYTGFLWVFGCGAFRNKDGFSVLRNTNNGNRLQIAFGGNYKNLSQYPVDGTRYTIDFNKNVFSLNTYQVELNTYNFQSSHPFGLFKVIGDVQNRSHVVQRIYSCKIYDNETLVRDFVPKLRSDGKYGLWDNVEDKFYLSADNIVFSGSLTE